MSIPILLVFGYLVLILVFVDRNRSTISIWNEK